MPARAGRRPHGLRGHCSPGLPGEPDGAGRQRGRAVVPPPGRVDGAAYVLDVGGALEHVVMSCSSCCHGHADLVMVMLLLIYSSLHLMINRGEGMSCIWVTLATFCRSLTHQ